MHLRQLGWAHLLRDFQGLIAAGGEGERIGAQLLAIGKQVFPHGLGPVTLCGNPLDRSDPIGTFVSHDGVAPTNNAAARSLRHAVIWRRLCFGTQSAGGSRFVETHLR